jgi:hypothetical protein
MNGNDIYLSYSYNREIVLPGIRIVLKRAAGAVEGDKPWNNTSLYWPSEPRCFLDNLTRDRKGGRNVTKVALEERLQRICEIRGEARLNEIRDEANAIAPRLARTSEAKTLSAIISSMLGSKPASHLKSAAVRGYAGGIDTQRLALFDQLANYLRVMPLPDISDIAAGEAQRNMAFLESYFSNFIEGTEFEITEAREIVFNNKLVESQPKDSHDVIGVFRQASDAMWRATPLSQSIDSLALLGARHADMMRERPEVQPGEIKMVTNQAGNTTFVLPRLVRGTFIEAAKRLNDLPVGLARALYAMFVVTEIHPFVDGNGRLARLVMNAELSAAGQCRIIVPTLYREPYIDSLRAATREADVATYVRTMTKIQDWTSKFNYSNLDAVLDTIKSSNAFETSLNRYQLLT